MKYDTKNSMILNQLKSLNDHQKSSLIDYLESIPRKEQNHKVYRNKALKEIREALQGV